MTDLEARLTRDNSLVSFLDKFDHSSDEYLREIKIFTDVIYKARKQSMKVLENVIKGFLTESGTKLNQKINRRRCNSFIIG